MRVKVIWPGEGPTSVDTETDEIRGHAVTTQTHEVGMIEAGEGTVPWWRYPRRGEGQLHEVDPHLEAWNLGSPKMESG
ncbi:hypothetical protein HPP92_026696 [Vanilla planifolia]|uniref:Uncharacterized protein n=1 Tax=Vanilla planifolia TaxID=51239 RepID=A0A835PCL6_VANPL|nr:hypothetical protein HPP92_026696 [Vanilla planifolia]